MNKHETFLIITRAQIYEARETIYTSHNCSNACLSSANLGPFAAGTNTFDGAWHSCYLPSQDDCLSSSNTHPDKELGCCSMQMGSNYP